MSLTRTVQRSELDPIMLKLRELGDEVRKLKNQHSPTHPIYKPDFPDDAVDAQIAFSDTVPEEAELPDTMPYWAMGNQWFPFGALPGTGRGIFKYIGLDGRADLTDPAISFPHPDWELRTSPTDEAMFDSDISDGIKFLLPGLYLTRNEMRAASDWGFGRLLALPNISGGGSADYMPGFGENDTRINQYFGEGSALSPAVGVGLVHEGILKITDPGTGIFFDLESDLDATHTNVLFQQFAMRLSPNPSPDQS